jgi:hypothetical protein
MSRIPSVTAVVTGFNPTKHLRCDCGAHVDLSAQFYRRKDGTASVKCLACGEILITDIAADISILDPEGNEGI